MRLFYLDGPDFRFEIFTQYAVEMNYTAVISDTASKNFVYEVDKLYSKYLFNGFRNCVGKYTLVIDPSHFVQESYPKVNLVIFLFKTLDLLVSLSFVVGNSENV